MAVFWIGYKRLEDLIPAMEAHRPVSVMAVTVPGPRTRHPVRFDTDSIMIAQGVDGELRYCQIPTGRWAMIGDDLVDTDPKTARERLARSESAMAAIRTYLVGCGFENQREALYSPPHNLQYLQGTADFLVFDRDVLRFRLRGPNDPAV